jgi:hypothetical protein
MASKSYPTINLWWEGTGPGCRRRNGSNLPLRSNIPRFALCATLDTYDFKLRHLSYLVYYSAYSMTYIV